MNEPSVNTPETEPGVASAEEGFVILDGPDGVAVTMTARAAEETARSLLSAAQAAARQQDCASDDSP